MKTKYLVQVLVFISTIFQFSCDDDNIHTCNTSSSDFQSLYASVLASNTSFIDAQFADTEVHEYTFILSSTKRLCRIGYQSHPNLATIPYEIKIVEASSNNIVYQGNHVFSSTTTSYVSPNTNVILYAGVTYKIQRIQTNWGSNIGNTIGRLLRDPNNMTLNFPFNSGIITITGSNFFQNGGPLINYGIPYIDMILIDP